MNTAYRMFKRRNGVFYIENNETGKQESLRTSDKHEAGKLLSAKNGAESNRLLNLALARAYKLTTCVCLQSPAPDVQDLFVVNKLS
jgi:hypothetical protein